MKTDYVEFVPVEVRIGDLAVRWVYIGEGLRGEFKADDLTDFPCLRFVCLRQAKDSDKLVPLPHGSVKTELSVKAEITHLLEIACRIIELLRVRNCENYAESLRLLSSLSRASLHDLPRYSSWPLRVLNEKD